jgi:hypothetical protein
MEMCERKGNVIRGEWERRGGLWLEREFEMNEGVW